MYTFTKLRSTRFFVFQPAFSYYPFSILLSGKERALSTEMFCAADRLFCWKTIHALLQIDFPSH